MKNEKLAHALNEVDDRYITEATATKRRHPYWIAAVAAILALVIAISMIPWSGLGTNEPNLEVPGTTGNTDNIDPTCPPNLNENDKPSQELTGIDLAPLQMLPDLLRAPTLPYLVPRPKPENYSNNQNEYWDAVAQWNQSQLAQFDQPDGYADSLNDFFRRSIKEFLSGEGNSAYSPVNVYLAMAMLAETTDGNSRQEILDLFGADSIEELRTQASHVWNAHYNNDGETTLLLANSLWLDEAYTFHQNTVDRLATDYYASVFGGNLGTDESNEQLQAWLNTMTGGLLKEQTENVKLSKYTVFALASTIYFKAAWENEFPEHLTADATFHAPGGDITTSFMHTEMAGIYFRGSNFGAIRLGLTGNNGMWIILPDEGVTVAEVLAGEEYLDLTLDPYAWENQTYSILDISLPKFDVTKQSDLIEGMENLGLTDIFDPSVSDFTPMTDASDLFVSQINHAARVVIDEKGVIAAAFTVIAVDGEAAGPSTVITFDANRPFAFIVSSRDNLPLFAGVVTEP